MNKFSFVLAGLLMAVSVSAVAATVAANGASNQQPLEEIAPFPEAEEGMSRQAIFLPKKENEGDFQVELLIGKVLEVDCNRPRMHGTLQSKTLAGWGYHYFILAELPPAASTMMGCPNNIKSEEFVAAHLGDAAMQRYNSRLPIVVYVPKDVEVRYRVWSASATTGRAVVK